VLLELDRLLIDPRTCLLLELALLAEHRRLHLLVVVLLSHRCAHEHRRTGTGEQWDMRMPPMAPRFARRGCGVRKTA
jgi:hypothetical protein